MYEIKFLESIENIKSFIKNHLQYKVNTEKAQQIASCVKQGRLFFEAAKNSPLEIKPLQLFYGTMAFSNAAILARTKDKLEHLKSSHGLAAEIGKKIIDNNVTVKDAGTFFAVNEVISSLEHVPYYIGTTLKRTQINVTGSQNLVNQKINIKDILGRIPNLNALFFNTFNEPPQNIGVSISIEDISSYPPLKAKIQIDYEYSVFDDIPSLKALVVKLREKHPFLNSWCLSEASVNWGRSCLEFVNVKKLNLDELDTLFQYPLNSPYYKTKLIGNPPEYFEFTEKIPLLTGGLSNSNQCILESFNNIFIPEFSLFYLGTFILSSIARYTPNVWMGAISHSMLKNEKADDAMLAIIEKFIDCTLSFIPNALYNILSLDFNKK